MYKLRKSCMITEEAHSAMIDHLEQLREKAQENANYKLNAPNIEQWVSEGILEKIVMYNQCSQEESAKRREADSKFFSEGKA